MRTVSPAFASVISDMLSCFRHKVLSLIVVASTCKPIAPFRQTPPMTRCPSRGNSMPITIYVFDAYGTLFDVNAAAQAAAHEHAHAALKDIWPKLAFDWRRKQLEYTWLRAVANRHCDFWQVTEDGLDWAPNAQNLREPT